MELCSLHPFEEQSVRQFVEQISMTGSDGARTNRNTVFESGTHAFARMQRGEERGSFELTHALASYFAEMQPSYVHAGLSLSTWEARIDRGAGMFLRPPSRLLIDAGFDTALARRLPIRLEMSRGMMGGAYLPARLVGQFEQLLETRLERTIRRLNESEMDGIAVFGLMFELARYCRSNGLAIFEAMDVITPNGELTLGRTGQIVSADKRRIDKTLRDRLEAAAKPPKKPGLLSRLSKRRDPSEEGDTS